MTAPLNCDSERGLLEGCKPVKGCQEFSVDDDGCDPFNFTGTPHSKEFGGGESRLAKYLNNAK
jgi:hypothetical protein